MEMQVPFGFAQGRLSTPLRYAPLRMTASFEVFGWAVFAERVLETEHWLKAESWKLEPGS
jgi:hypothetical protein